MDVILVPGLWLDASSWDAVTPPLTEAGHRVHPLTLPAAPGAGIRDWVDAVVARIDASADPVVLVGHSGGGNVVWGAADARPDRVSRVIFVDTMPPPPGAMISEFPVHDGVVPFPGWDFFDAPDIADLDDDTRRRVATTTVDVPGSVPTDPIPLTDERRHDIPVTVLSGRLDEDGIRQALTEWGAFAREFEALSDVEVVTLGTGHWPQFSRPEALVQALLDAVR